MSSSLPVLDKRAAGPENGISGGSKGGLEETTEGLLVVSLEGAGSNPDTPDLSRTGLHHLDAVVW